MNYGLQRKSKRTKKRHCKDERVNKVEDVVKVGDIVKVKVVEIDKMGKVSLTMRPSDFK